MKKNHLALLALSLMVVYTTFSCSERTTTPIESEVFKVSTDDTVSLATFNRWTSSWRIKGQEYTETTLVQSFTMPLVDVTEVLGEAPTQVRYFLGLDTLVQPYEPHILLVGVDANGQNMLNYSKEEYAYDTTCPCPPACVPSLCN